MATLTQDTREELIIALRGVAPELEEDGPFDELSDEDLLDNAKGFGLANNCEGCDETFSDTELQHCEWDDSPEEFVTGGEGLLCERCRRDLHASAVDVYEKKPEPIAAPNTERWLGVDMVEVARSIMRFPLTRRDD